MARLTLHDGDAADAAADDANDKGEDSDRMELNPPYPSRARGTEESMSTDVFGKVSDCNGGNWPGMDVWLLVALIPGKELKERRSC